MRRKLRRLWRNKYARWTGIVAIMALVVGIGLAVQVGGNPSKAGSPDGQAGSHSHSSTDDPTVTTTKKRAATTTIKGVPKNITEELYYPVIGLDIKTLPPHHLVLSVTSSDGSVARVGFIVPTSEDNPYGDSKDTASPWSRSFDVYGPGKYALVFLQSDAAGASLTCTISVDGKVVASRTTHGPYGRGYCIG